jgi:hypothetical protein
MALPALGTYFRQDNFLHIWFFKAALCPSGDECTAIFDIQNLGMEGKLLIACISKTENWAKCVCCVFSCLALEVAF